MGKYMVKKELPNPSLTPWNFSHVINIMSICEKYIWKMPLIVMSWINIVIWKKKSGFIELTPLKRSFKKKSLKALCLQTEKLARSPKKTTELASKHKQSKMNNDDSPVLLYAHPSMYLLAEEIVNMCTVLSNGYSQSSQSERPCVSKRSVKSRDN